MKVIRYTSIKTGDVISVLTDVAMGLKKRPVYRMKRDSIGLGLHADYRPTYTRLAYVLVLNSPVISESTIFEGGYTDSKYRLFHVLTDDGPTYIEIWEDEVEILLHTV